jgi:enoyl-CoA hydratase/carnithine racemase
MNRKADLSLLKPFLALESCEWGDVIRFTDDLLAMADTQGAFESFQCLLKDLQGCPGKAIVFWSTSHCFSPERCDMFFKRLGDLHKRHTVSNYFSMTLSAVTMTREENMFGQLLRWLRSVERPVLMVFQGDIELSFLGMGLACDYRIATTDIVFHNHCRTLNISPGLGLLYLLPAYVGFGRANALVTSTKDMTGDKALEWGLLDHVVVPEDLDQSVQALALEKAAISPETLGTIKQLLNHHLPNVEAYFKDEAKGIDRALAEKPWEKLSDSSAETE